MDGLAVNAMAAGIGAGQALTAARALAAKGARCLVSWGFAGALDPALSAGRLVFATALVDARGASSPVDGAFAQRLGQCLEPLDPVRAALADSPHAVADPRAKAELRRASGAVAVDMESAALGRFAGEHGLGFAVVRAIVDDAATSLPATALAAVDERGGTAWLALGRSLVRHPQDLWALTRFSRAVRRAERTLRRAARLCFEERP